MLTEGKSLTVWLIGCVLQPVISHGLVEHAAENIAWTGGSHLLGGHFTNEWPLLEHEWTVIREKNTLYCNEAIMSQGTTIVCWYLLLLPMTLSSNKFLFCRIIVENITSFWTHSQPLPRERLLILIIPIWGSLGRKCYKHEENRISKRKWRKERREERERDRERKRRGNKW